MQYQWLRQCKSRSHNILQTLSLYACNCKSDEVVFLTYHCVHFLLSTLSFASHFSQSCTLVSEVLLVVCVFVADVSHAIFNWLTLNCRLCFQPTCSLVILEQGSMVKWCILSFFLSVPPRLSNIINIFKFLHWEFFYTYIKGKNIFPKMLLE